MYEADNRVIIKNSKIYVDQINKIIDDLGSKLGEKLIVPSESLKSVVQAWANAINCYCLSIQSTFTETTRVTDLKGFLSPIPPAKKKLDQANLVLEETLCSIRKEFLSINNQLHNCLSLLNKNIWKFKVSSEPNRALFAHKRAVEKYLNENIGFFRLLGVISKVINLRPSDLR